MLIIHVKQMGIHVLADDPAVFTCILNLYSHVCTSDRASSIHFLHGWYHPDVETRFVTKGSNWKKIPFHDPFLHFRSNRLDVILHTTMLPFNSKVIINVTNNFLIGEEVWSMWRSYRHETYQHWTVVVLDGYRCQSLPHQSGKHTP